MDYKLEDDTLVFVEEGKKNDNGKLRWDLLPFGPVRHVVGVLTFGAGEYGVGNWKQVQNPRSRYFSAMMRHIDAWWSGETHDAKSGMHHLAHAVCCALFLLWFDGIR